VGWHESIGESLLHALGLPDRIVEAVRDHDQPRATAEAPCTLRDVLYFANLLAGGSFEGLSVTDSVPEPESRAQDRERYADLLLEAEEDIRELRAALGG
jgi:HD-like signal output (HDOD) protein